VHHDLLDMRGIYDELVARGVNPQTQLLEYEERVAPSEVAARLRSGRGKLIHFKRLYLRRGEPFAVSWVYLASTMHPSREEVARYSTYQLFDTLLGVKVSRADLSVRARSPTPQLRRVLRLRAGVPLIALERVSYDASAGPLEYTLYWANSESYEFVMRLRGKLSITSSIQEFR